MLPLASVRFSGESISLDSADAPMPVVLIEDSTAMVVSPVARPAVLPVLTMGWPVGDFGGGVMMGVGDVHATLLLFALQPV